MEQVIGVIAQGLHRDRQNDIKDLALGETSLQEYGDIGLARESAFSDHHARELCERRKPGLRYLGASADRIGDWRGNLGHLVSNEAVCAHAVAATVLVTDREEHDFLFRSRQSGFFPKLLVTQ